MGISISPFLSLLTVVRVTSDVGRPGVSVSVFLGVISLVSTRFSLFGVGLLPPPLGGEVDDSL